LKAATTVEVEWATMDQAEAQLRDTTAISVGMLSGPEERRRRWLVTKSAI
jgi:hypothetical protein